MTIETKYKIGDEVWFHTLGINYRANIVAITVNILIDGDVIINYNLERVGYHYERNEDELFWTKEDLLRILQL